MPGVSSPTAYRSVELRGGRWPGLAVTSKSGAFGEPDSLATLFLPATGPPSVLMRTSMISTTSRLCITMGDPAGIGPEIVLKAAAALSSRAEAGEFSLQVAGCASVLDEAAAKLGLTPLSHCPSHRQSSTLARRASR